MKPGDLHLTIRIDPKEKVRLQAEADAEGLSLSAYVRRVLLGLQTRKAEPPKK